MGTVERANSLVAPEAREIAKGDSLLWWRLTGRRGAPGWWKLALGPRCVLALGEELQGKWKLALGSRHDSALQGKWEDNRAAGITIT